MHIVLSWYIVDLGVFDKGKGLITLKETLKFFVIK